MPILTALDDLRRVLTEARTIAVLGAHHERQRPAFYVPDYLHTMGYRVLPVNPTLVGQTLWGEPVVSTLGDLTTPFDLVDVFRPASALPSHLAELLALGTPGHRPVIWFQLGIIHRDIAATLDAAGFEVIQDRCTYADHRLFQLPPVAPGDRATRAPGPRP